LRWFSIVAVGVLALLVWSSSGRSQAPAERLRAVLGSAIRRLPSIEPRVSVVNDPLVPDRPARLIGKRDGAFAGVSAQKGSMLDTLLPTEQDRRRKSPEARGGIDPCNSPDPGFGIYEKWRWGGGAGKLLVPTGALNGAATADALFHFAGYELARKEVARSEAPLVFLGVAFGSGGLNYRENLSGPLGLHFLQKAVSASLERVQGAPSELGHVGLAAWSAGYDAVRLVLQQSKNADEVDAVVLLDGLHASRDDASAMAQLSPFTRFAERAARGQAFMFVSYSSVPTDGYASTHETSRRLIRALGGEPLKVERLDAGGLELKEMFSKGGFHARGYRGGGELDHCAHLMLYPMVLEALTRYWHTH